MLEIPVLRGDGIGPEIVDATVEIMGEACRLAGIGVAFEQLPSGLKAISTYGTTMPKTTLERLNSAEAWILGPLSTHLYDGSPSQPNVSGFLRRHFDLYANIRPISGDTGRRGRRGRDTGAPKLDVIIVRENTEGFYADRNMFSGNGEFLPTEDVALAVRVITRRASERIAKVAFDEADRYEIHKKVTIVHKANVLRATDGLFVAACETIGRMYPHIELNDLHIDAAATALITNPDDFAVVVTTNMFGDILSNEAAGLVGGLGFSPSLNRGDDRAMAQASHGSAPELEGTGRANPIAEILSGALLLEWLASRTGLIDLVRVGIAMRRAVQAVLEQADPTNLTPDMGGTGSTSSFTAAVVASLDLDVASRDSGGSGELRTKSEM